MQIQSQTDVPTALRRLSAVHQAIQLYPWLSKLGAPISLTEGAGPYQSESYMPNADENPNPGNYNIQLRSNKAKGNESTWPALVGSESLDWLARQDPTYQKTALQFLASMTPQQLKVSRKRYAKEGDPRSFEDFMKGAEIQEYIRGYLFPEAAPGWKGKKGEGQYTTEQTKLLDNLLSYLKRK